MWKCWKVQMYQRCVPNTRHFREYFYSNSSHMLFNFASVCIIIHAETQTTLLNFFYKIAMIQWTRNTQSVNWNESVFNSLLTILCFKCEIVCSMSLDLYTNMENCCSSQSGSELYCGNSVTMTKIQMEECLCSNWLMTRVSSTFVIFTGLDKVALWFFIHRNCFVYESRKSFWLYNPSNQMISLMK